MNAIPEKPPEDWRPPVAGEVWVGYFGDRPMMAERRERKDFVNAQAEGTWFHSPYDPTDRVWFADYVIAPTWHRWNVETDGAL